nr:unnamed protein product [Spirometra erinaceieuropaei]
MPRKAAPKRAYGMTCPIPTGFQLNSDSSRQWVIDQVVGQGGFGRIYCAYQRDKPRLKNYVVKIEPQENGPLFTEIHFYMRVCKQELLEEWKTQRGLNFLGIPRETTRNRIVQMKENSMRDFSTFSESAGFGCLPALENFLRLVGTLGYSDPPNYTLLESTLRELAKSLSLKGNHGASHRPSDRSRVVFKKKLPPSTDNSVDSQTEVRSVTKKSNFLSNHVVDTYCGSSIDRHPEVGAHPSPHLLREHEAPRRSPRLKAGCAPGAARANGHFHVEVATKSPPRPPTCNISGPQACQSSLDYISSLPTPNSADYAHRRRPKRYVGPQPDGTVSPLLVTELPVCQPSVTRRARTVTKASVSSQTSPHLLAVARARANERRRQAL